MSDEAQNCLECGACCYADWDGPDYAHVTSEESAELEAAGHGHLLYRDGGALKTAYDTYGNCKCAALTGTLGGQVSCSIYDLRPQVCQRFTAGSAACHGARRAAGLEFSDR